MSLPSFIGNEDEKVFVCRQHSCAIFCFAVTTSFPELSPGRPSRRRTWKRGCDIVPNDLLPFWKLEKVRPAWGGCIRKDEYIGRNRHNVELFFDSNFSYARYAEEIFTQIYRDLYGDAMLMPIRMGTNMAAGNNQKHLLLSFATKAWILFLTKLKNINKILFLLQELFR